MKLTVKEYATQLNVSIQSVYKKIKRGSVPTVKENNITYVIVDSLEVEKVVNPVQSKDCTGLLNIIKRRDKEVKQLNKEIKRLTKKLSQSENDKSKVYLSYIAELKQLQLQAPASTLKNEKDIIEINTKKKSKKRKKK